MRRKRFAVTVAALVAATVLSAGVPAVSQGAPTVGDVPAGQAQAVRSGQVSAAAVTAGACAFNLNQGSYAVAFGVNNHYAIGQIACLMAPPAYVGFGWIKISELNGPAKGVHATAPSTGFKPDSVISGPNYLSNRVSGILREAEYRAYLIDRPGYIWAYGPAECSGYFTDFLTCDFRRYFG
jgi:hypothetical protein